jgi:hypothetical protein
MHAKKIRLKYYPNIWEDIKKWRNQGYKGEVIIYDTIKGVPTKRGK